MAGPVHRLEHPQSIRAVFFDAGYTMLAPHPSTLEIVTRVLAQRGIPSHAEHLARQLPAADAALRQRVKEQPSTWGDNSAIEAVWTEYFSLLLAPLLADRADTERAECVRDVVRALEEAESYALYPDVLPVLRALKERDFTLGVISDWDVGLAQIMRHHDLITYFDFAVVSAAVRLAKPDPELFETALRRADAIADYTVHIGDSYVLDVLGARAVGITPVLLDRRHRTDGQRLDCLVVHDLYGLLDLLDLPRHPSELPASEQ